MILDPSGSAIPEQPSKRYSFVVSVLGLAVIFCLMMAGQGFWKAWHAKPTFSNTPVFSGSGTISAGVFYYPIDTQPEKFVAVPEGDIRREFDKAIAAWKAALGGKLPIKYPRLMKSADGRCSTHPATLAYAEPELGRIIVCQVDGPNIETVMLHEVGHLLGVPHIEDDPVMNSRNTGILAVRPSLFAVAIAKSIHGIK